MNTTKVSFGILSISLALAGQVQAQSFLTNGLVAYYPFNGNAKDMSGNGNDATVYGSITFVPSASGDAANFAGASGYIACNSATLGDFGQSDFAISCWFKTMTGGGLVGKRSNCGCVHMFDLRVGRSAYPGVLPQDVLFEVGDGSSCPFVEVPLVFTNGVWHHVVVVRSGTTMSCYTDGNLGGQTITAAIANVTSSTPVVIGRSACAGLDSTPVFLGEIDEVRIYNRALSAAEVQQLYTLGTVTVSKPGDTYLKGTCSACATNGLGITSSYATNGGVLVAPSGNLTPDCTFRFFLPPPVVGTNTLDSVTVLVYGKSVGVGGGLTGLYIGNDTTDRSGWLTNNDAWNLVGTFTGAAAQALVSPAGDGIGSVLDMRLQVNNYTYDYDLSQVQVTYTYDGVDRRVLNSLAEAYAAYQAVVAFEACYSNSWDAEEFAKAEFNAGLQWGFSQIPNLADLAVELVDSTPLTVWWEMRALTDANSLANEDLLDRGLDYDPFEDYYGYYGYGPPEDVILEDFNNATNSLGALASSWTNAFGGLTGSGFSAISAQITAATASLTQLTNDLQQVARGLNYLYQLRWTLGNGTVGSSGQGDEEAEVLLNVLSPFMGYDYAPGQNPFQAPPLDTNSLLPEIEVEISSQTNVLAALAAQQLGSVQVTISPAGAISAGAQWQVDAGPWKNSGDLVSGLALGSHNLAFKTITGWITPASQSPTISANQTTTATGTYVQQFGALQVTISPAGAVNAGAKWQVDGGAWQGSGATISNLTVGGHSVVFNTIAGWNTPASQNPTINGNSTTTESATYTPQTIAATLSGGQIVLSWSTNTVGFVLECSTNLSAGSWVGATPPPAVVNGAYTVTNGISGRSMFYRLRKE